MLQNEACIGGGIQEVLGQELSFPRAAKQNLKTFLALEKKGQRSIILFPPRLHKYIIYSFCFFNERCYCICCFLFLAFACHNTAQL